MKAYRAELWSLEPIDALIGRRAGTRAVL